MSLLLKTANLPDLELEVYALRVAIAPTVHFSSEKKTNPYLVDLSIKLRYSEEEQKRKEEALESLKEGATDLLMQSRAVRSSLSLLGKGEKEFRDRVSQALGSLIAQTIYRAAGTVEIKTDISKLRVDSPLEWEDLKKDRKALSDLIGKLDQPIPRLAEEELRKRRTTSLLGHGYAPPILFVWEGVAVRMNVILSLEVDGNQFKRIPETLSRLIRNGKGSLDYWKMRKVEDRPKHLIIDAQEGVNTAKYLAKDFEKIHLKPVALVFEISLENEEQSSLSEEIKAVEIPYGRERVQVVMENKASLALVGEQLGETDKENLFLTSYEGDKLSKAREALGDLIQEMEKVKASDGGRLSKAWAVASSLISPEKPLANLGPCISGKRLSLIYDILGPEILEQGPERAMEILLGRPLGGAVFESTRGLEPDQVLTYIHYPSEKRKGEGSKYTIGLIAEVAGELTDIRGGAPLSLKDSVHLEASVVG